MSAASESRQLTDRFVTSPRLAESSAMAPSMNAEGRSPKRSHRWRSARINQASHRIGYSLLGSRSGPVHASIHPATAPGCGSDAVLAWTDPHCRTWRLAASSLAIAERNVSIKTAIVSSITCSASLNCSSAN